MRPIFDLFGSSGCQLQYSKLTSNASRIELIQVNYSHVLRDFLVLSDYSTAKLAFNASNHAQQDHISVVCHRWMST